MQLIVGDVGATNARLALAETDGRQVELTHAAVYPSQAYADFAPLLATFRAELPTEVSQAVIGIAGPVIDNACEATNLPWSLDGAGLAQAARLDHVELLNDLEAAAWGIEALTEVDLIELHPGAPRPRGNQSVIAAGTGLGQAGRVWCGERYRPFASEGAHGDFAPTHALGYSLHQWLQAKYGRVSWERVVSGQGLVDLHAFLRDAGGRRAPDWLTQAMEESSAASAIANAALMRRDGVCAEALDLFIHYYGAEAGNHALKLMATGGVYLAGGIAPKVSSRFAEAGFLEAFFDKGRMRPLLERMPVRLIVNDRLAQLGAALCGAALTEGRP